MRVILAAALISFVPNAAWAADPSPLCAPLRLLAENTARSGRAHRISFLKLDAMESACARSESDDAETAYCHAALEASGIEFSHRYPRIVLACLKADRVRAVTEWRNEYTGFTDNRKLVHLAARLPQGVFLDIRYEPEPDQPPGMFETYYGRYRLVIWPASPAS